MQETTDSLSVLAIPLSESEVQVTLSGGGHMFFRIVLAPHVVEDWVKNDELAARTLECMLGSHPAAVIVNDLIPLLPGLMHTDPEKLKDVADFKHNTLDMLQQLGYIK